MPYILSVVSDFCIAKVTSGVNILPQPVTPPHFTSETVGAGLCYKQAPGTHSPAEQHFYLFPRVILTTSDGTGEVITPLERQKRVNSTNKTNKPMKCLV